MLSQPRFKTDLFKRPLDQVLVTDFFGGVQSVLLTENAYPLNSQRDFDDASSKSVADERKRGVRIPKMSATKSTTRSSRQQRIVPKSLEELVPLNFMVGVLIFSTLVGISMY